MTPGTQDQQLTSPGIFWRRCAAVLLDLALLGTFGTILSAVFFEALVRMGERARLIGLVIALLYATVLDARGGTPGKKLVGLRVSGPAGELPGLARALARNLIRIGPWFLINLRVPWPGLFRIFTASLPIALYQGSALAVAFDKPHRALHDWFAGTRVEKAAVPTVDFAGATWRTVALFAVPLLVIPLFLASRWNSAQPGPLNRVMESLLALPYQPVVHVTDRFVTTRDSKQRVIEVSATFEGPADGVPGLARQIADRVGNSGADFSPWQSLNIAVWRVADLGIGRFTESHIEILPIAQGKVGAPLANFTKLASDGPLTWSIGGTAYEIRSWFLETKSKNGTPGLFYLVEWNCPACDPRDVTDERARELMAPLFNHVCETASWRRFSLQSGQGPVPASNIAIQIVDRGTGGGGVYPHYGVAKTVSQACGGLIH